MARHGGLRTVERWRVGWVGAGLAAFACSDVHSPPGEPGGLPSLPVAGSAGEGGSGAGGFASSGAAGMGYSGMGGVGGTGCGAAGGVAGDGGAQNACGAGGTGSEPEPITSGNPDCSAGACRHGGSCIEASGITCDCPESELTACGEVRFRSVGFLADTNSTAPRALDGTGSTLIGTSYLMRRSLGGDSVEPGWQRAFRWTLATGITALELPEGVGESEANAISDDGSVIIGARDRQVFRWENGSTSIIAELDYDSSAFIGDASYDAEILVGVGYSPAMHAIRWSAESGLLTLENTPPELTAAYAISGDGRIVVGIAGGLDASDTYDYRAVRWLEGGAIEDLPVPSGVDAPVPYQINVDGSVIAGHGTVGDAGVALRWTAAGVEVLPNVIPTTTAAAYSVSDDGSVIAGRRDEAAIWMPDGPHAVKELLEDAGVDLTGWFLATAWVVSSDGKVLVGDGDFQGAPHTWIAWLP